MKILNLLNLVFIKNYVGFKGRSGRREFLVYVLFTLAVVILLALAFYLTSPEPGNPDAPTNLAQNIVLGMWLLFMLGTALPGIAVHMRRLHDLGQSGSLYFLVSLLSMIPGLGLLILLVFGLILLLTPGQSLPNRWGSPVAEQPMETV